MIGDRRIHLCLAHPGGSEQRYIDKAFETNWIGPLGKNVDDFEQQLKDRIGCGKEIVGVSSGTAAIHLALKCIGPGPGDEVIVQDFTFCASANPVTYLGAKPVFVDSEKESWNMDPELLEEAILDRLHKKNALPKAIIPVSLYGMPYQVDRILAVASKYGIPVVEDTAEGLGSLYDGKQIGTFGNYGILSFNGNKMITTSVGGAVICPSEKEKQKILWYATQARDAYPFYHHSEIGYNYRMSNVCAGIGLGQMEVLDSHIGHHRMLNKLYKELFSGIKGITVQDNPSAMFDSNFWLSTIVLDKELHIKGQEKIDDSTAAGNTEALRRILDKAGVESRLFWKPMHLQPVFANCPAYTNGVSESLFKAGLCMPSGPMVTPDDARYIVETIKNSID